MEIKVGNTIYEYILKSGKDVPEGIYSAVIKEIFENGSFIAMDNKYPDTRLIYSESDFGKKWFTSATDAKKYKIHECEQKIRKLNEKICEIENMEVF